MWRSHRNARLIRLQIAKMYDTYHINPATREWHRTALGIDADAFREKHPYKMLNGGDSQVNGKGPMYGWLIHPVV